MTDWTNTDLENIGNILINDPSGNPLGYKIKNITGVLTDTYFNSDPLIDPGVGYEIDNAIFLSIQNTHETQFVYIDDKPIPPGSTFTYPNAGNVKQATQFVRCGTGGTAIVIYQYKQLI